MAMFLKNCHMYALLWVNAFIWSWHVLVVWLCLICGWIAYFDHMGPKAHLPSWILKDRLGDQRGGEWMGADKNSSRRRLKLWQDEPARSDPQNHTLRTSTFRLPTPRSHWSATSHRNKLYQQPHQTRSHDSGNTSKAGCLEGAVRPGIGGG
jgi:hypothetical protein